MTMFHWARVVSCAVLFSSLCGQTSDRQRIDGLILDLKNGTREAKDRAVAELVKLGAPAAEALVAELRKSEKRSSLSLEETDFLGFGLLPVFQKIGPPAVPALRHALRSGRNWLVRTTAITALTFIGDRSALVALQEVAKSEQDPQIRRMAQQAADGLLKTPAPLDRPAAEGLQAPPKSSEKPKPPEAPSSSSKAETEAAARPTERTSPVTVVYNSGRKATLDLRGFSVCSGCGGRPFFFFHAVQAATSTEVEIPLENIRSITFGGFWEGDSRNLGGFFQCAVKFVNGTEDKGFVRGIYGLEVYDHSLPKPEVRIPIGLVREMLVRQ